MLPEDPNPYDSYAELLMKMGRYQESIENYERALAKDPNFVASLVGIGNNQIFLGEFDEARESFEQLHGVARNEGERRQAMFWTAVSHLHEGHHGKALEALEERYEIALTIHPLMCGTLTSGCRIICASLRSEASLSVKGEAP